MTLISTLEFTLYLEIKFQQLIIIFGTKENIGPIQIWSVSNQGGTQTKSKCFVVSAPSIFNARGLAALPEDTLAL